MQVEHYQHGECETVEFVEEVLRLIPCSKEKAWAIGNALKYACRAGYKGDWKQDAVKCADFMTRAIYGAFLDEQDSSKVSECFNQNIFDTETKE